MDALTHQVGVYALTSPSDVHVARELLGVDLVVGKISAQRPKYVDALKSAGVNAIDSSPQAALYAARCPDGKPSCRSLSVLQREKLQLRLEQIAKEAIASEVLAGFYVVDDFWTDMSRDLPLVASTLRTTAPDIPLVCGIQSNLSVDGSASTGAMHSVKNFDSRWCDAIIVYSYAPSTSVPHSSGGTDWGMDETLPRTLNALRRKGWDMESQPLIGAPQAFNFNPRTGIPRGAHSAQYRRTTNRRTLALQTEAFCRYGATSIIAYAWNDGSTGNVGLLNNDPKLRAGLLDGIVECQRIWRQRD